MNYSPFQVGKKKPGELWSTYEKVIEVHIDPPELAGKRPVCLTWVPGHTGIPGNERADQLARLASSEAFVGPEPALPISHTVIKTAMRDWAYREGDKRWQGLTTCRPAKEMI